MFIYHKNNIKKGCEKRKMETEQDKMIDRILKKASEITKNHNIKCVDCVERTFKELKEEGFDIDKILIKDIFIQIWEDPDDYEWYYLTEGKNVGLGN